MPRRVTLVMPVRPDAPITVAAMDRDRLDRDAELEDLETAVLDGLDAADDAEAPAGTSPLSAARRRRALSDLDRLFES
jgi:hypothetical protein